MTTAIYTPSLEYTIADPGTGAIREMRGHAVGQFVIRRTAPFPKAYANGTALCLDPWSIEHPTLGEGVLSVVTFDAALFIAGELDRCAAGAVFSDRDALHAFLRTVERWMRVQDFNARYYVPLLTFDAWRRKGLAA